MHQKQRKMHQKQRKKHQKRVKTARNAPKTAEKLELIPSTIQKINEKLELILIPHEKKVAFH